jgi:hypothetical protein
MIAFETTLYREGIKIQISIHREASKTESDQYNHLSYFFSINKQTNKQNLFLILCFVLTLSFKLGV